MKKRSEEEFRFPHQIECAIRSLAHGSNGIQCLGKFLMEQQRPDFDAQAHLFTEAVDEFQKALRWAERATRKP